MAKTDKEAIDKLIEEVLNEKFYPEPGTDKYKTSTQFPFHKNAASTTDSAIDGLKQAQPGTATDRLNDADIEYLINNPDKITFDHVKATRILIAQYKKGIKDGHFKRSKTKAQDTIDFLAQVEAKYDERIQAAIPPETTITSPEFATRRGDAASGTAAFPPEQMAIIKRAMGGATSFKQRIEKISQMSKRLYNASRGKYLRNIKDRAVSEILNDILLLDIFNYIVKDMDAGASAYLFEYFLALLFEGRVTGKDLTDDGKMGATDFVTKGNNLGSAKYYASKGSVEQAKAGFPLGKNVNYIVGLKKEDTSQVGQDTEAGKADPARIVAIDLYLFKVQQSSKGVFQAAAGGTFDKTLKDGSSKKKVALGPMINSKSFIGTVHLCSSPTSNFSEMIEDVMNKDVGDVKLAFTEMKEMFKEMISARANVKQYISSGEINIGNKALESMTSAENRYKNLVDAMAVDTKNIGGTKYYGKMDTNREKIVQEIKFTELDRLIAEVLKENT